MLLIVTGLPATGKTRLARKFASERGWPLLAKDTIKEWLFDHFGAGDAQWSRALSDASFTILFALAREFVVAGQSCVIEGNFRPGLHEAALRDVLQAAAQTPPRCVQVLCRVDEVERRRRLQARAADPARHPGHADSLLLTAERNSDDFLDLPGEQLRHDSGDAVFDNVMERLNAL
jgi:predicted kinase